MLTNSNFESNMQFLLWANVIFNIHGICKVAQHKCCLALTLQYLHPSTNDFISAKHIFYASKNTIFSLPKMYSKLVGQAICKLTYYIFNIMANVFSQDCSTTLNNCIFQNYLINICFISYLSELGK